MGRSGYKLSHAQRGMAMVELAITLPLLAWLMLTFGEFGRMLFQYNSLMQASRDAGRFAAAQALDSTLGTVSLSSSLISQTQNVAVYGVPANPNGYPPVVPGLTTGNVQVSTVGTDHVQVSISYTFVPVIGSSLPALYGSSVPLGLALTSTIVMRAL